MRATAHPTQSTYIELARTIYIYGVYTVNLAGRSPNIRSYTVHIYGSGQPYTYTHKHTWHQMYQTQQMQCSKSLTNASKYRILDMLNY